MDYKIVSAVLFVVCLLLAVNSLTGVKVEQAVVNDTVDQVDDLRVSYLYPLRCVDCSLDKPGQCDYCTSYYDIRTMDMLSSELGVPVEFHVSDSVGQASVFITYKGKATLSDGRTRYNIANSLCRFSNLEKSCKLFDKELGRIKSCLVEEGVPEGAVIYHGSSENCGACTKTDGVISKLKEIEEDGKGYTVFTIDHAKDKSIISKCLSNFDGINYAPQLLCPPSGKDLTGEFTLSQARDFSDRCAEAYGYKSPSIQ